MSKEDVIKKLDSLINTDLKLTAQNSEDLRNTLKKAGYEQRCGTCSYQRPYLTIQPFKQYFWEDNIEYQWI